MALSLIYADQTHLAREKAKADAEYYKAERQAESYKVCEHGLKQLILLVLLVLSPHADRHPVDISFIACFCTCLQILL